MIGTASLTIWTLTVSRKRFRLTRVVEAGLQDSSLLSIASAVAAIG